MIGSLLLFLQTITAPAPNLLVRQAEVLQVVPVVNTSVGQYIAADALVRVLGARVEQRGAGHHRITIGEARLDVIEGVPFVRADSVVVPLTAPPERRGGVLSLPFELVTAVIPRFVTGYNFDASARELRKFPAQQRVALVNGSSPSAVPVTGSRASETTSGTNGARLTPAATSNVVKPVMSAAPRGTRLRQRRLVVVDAGHGGVDPGMKGPIGPGTPIVEKHITLSVARILADELRRRGVEVLMTRTRDTLIALSDRGRIANRSRGDLFVSIHVNAAGTRGASGARWRGFETYFLAEAKTEDARRVEQMENEAVKFETGANAPKGDPLSFIINDMAQNEHLRESSELAENVQNALRAFHPGPNRGVHQANFAVLRGSFMPAVLVEIGFGTNPEEADYLSRYQNQREIASGVADAVLAYLLEYEGRTSSGGTR